MAETALELQKKDAATPEGRSRNVYTPAVDIIERKDDIVILADMPGVDEQSVDITLEKNVLTIYGRTDIELPQGLKLVAAEYDVGDFQRTFTLSDKIDKGRIHASVKNGVVKLILPKAEEVKTRKITVKAE